MGLLRSAGAPRRSWRAGLFLHPGKRHLAAEHKRMLDAWVKSPMPLLTLQKPLNGGKVLYRAALDRDMATLAQRVTTNYTDDIATKLDITVLHAAPLDHDRLISDRATKHVDTARLQAEAAGQGVFADRLPRLPPNPQPWRPVSIIINDEVQTGKQQDITPSEQIAYVSWQGMLVELHSHAIDLDGTRLESRQPNPMQLGR